MSTAINTAMVDHSALDGTGDAINGSEVDENTTLIAKILDGTTATDLGGAGTIDILALRVLDIGAAAGAVQSNLTLEWDPASGNMTDNSSGVGMQFKMPDDANNQDIFAEINAMCVSDATGAEEGEISLKVLKAAVSTEVVTIQSGAVVVGVDDVGLDFTVFGDTTAKFMKWDTGTDSLELPDNTNLTFGTGQDADMYYDGTNLIVNPRVVGTGGLLVSGAGKLYLNDAGGEYLSSDGAALTIASGAAAWILPVADGSANQVLETDASGNLDWVSLSAGAVTALNSATENELVTVGNTTTELDAEATLLYNGTQLFVGDTANAGVTGGATLNMIAADDFILTLKSTDVNNEGIYGEADDFAAFEKFSAASGGLKLTAMANDGISQGMDIRSYSGEGSLSPSTTSTQNFMLHAFQHSNGTVANASANACIFGVGTHKGGAEVNVFIVDEDGNLFSDESATVGTFDSEPSDALMMRAGRHGLLNGDAPLWMGAETEEVERLKNVLQEQRIIMWNKDTDSVPFLCVNKAVLVAWDGLYQAHQERNEIREVCDLQQEQIESMGAELNLLKEKN